MALLESLGVTVKNIFQIYLSDSGEIAPAIRACMQSIREGTTGYEYRQFDQAGLRAFIQESFPAPVLAAYDMLRPYAYKADLGRYCLLLRHGGWYIDAAVTLQSGLPDTGGYRHVLFKDAPRVDLRSQEVANGLLYAEAGSKVLETAIALIVENCRLRKHGDGPLDPTGPGLLGRALELCSGDPAAMFGRYMPLTPEHPRKNYAFVLPEGTILAWGKVTHGTDAPDGLLAFKAVGTNSYNILWERGLVYDQPNLGKRCLASFRHIFRTLLRRILRKFGIIRS